MTIEQLTNTLTLATVLGAWIFVVFKMIPLYRMDIFRQRLFEIRAELFDFAAAGNIAFNDPAYVSLRSYINAHIRHARQITFFRIVLNVAAEKVLTHPKPVIGWSGDWQHDLRCVKDQETREFLETIHQRIIRASGKHVVRGSIPLLLATAMFAGWEAISALSERSVSSAKEFLSMLKDLWRVGCRKVLVGVLDPQRIEEYALGTQPIAHSGLVGARRPV